MLLGTLLTWAAVEIGMLSRVAGLIALVPVILLRLLIFVVMFLILRDGLPDVRLNRRRGPQSGIQKSAVEDEDMDGGTVFANTLLAVLIPFYIYYAGWGLLADTLRDYSQAFLNTQMERIDFKTPMGPSALSVSSTIWVVLAVVLIWIVRRGAKAMHKRGHGGFWPLLVVACEASWVLLGLYVIDGWQEKFADWLAALPPSKEWLNWIVSPASAQITDINIRPVDWAPTFRLWPWLTDLFWYSVLPLVWFNLGAIVYGHDLNMLNERTQHLAGRTLERWNALPKPVTDFIGHFWVGLVKRWHAMVNGIFLAASAGIALSVSVIVLWRLADWLSRWSWVGVAQLIGPQDSRIWSILTTPLSIVFGGPGQPQDGLIANVVQFCILSAGLELAGRSQQEQALNSIRSEPA